MKIIPKKFPNWLIIFLIFSIISALAVFSDPDYRKSPSVYPGIYKIDFLTSLDWRIVSIILQKLSAVSIISSAVIYIRGDSDRKKRTIFEAWKVVDTVCASGVLKSYALIEALEYLASESVSLQGIKLNNQANDNQSKKILDIKGINLHKANLENADLSYVDLSNANLSHTNLSNANLSYANLSNANLSNANLAGTTLLNCVLSKATLTNVQLNNKQDEKAKLSGLILKETDLYKANFNNRNLSDFDCSNVDLSSSDLSKFQFEKTIFKNAILKGTIFKDGDFSGAFVDGANFTDAILENVDLRQMNLNCFSSSIEEYYENLNQQQLEAEHDYEPPTEEESARQEQIEKIRKKRNLPDFNNAGLKGAKIKKKTRDFDLYNFKGDLDTIFEELPEPDRYEENEYEFSLCLSRKQINQCVIEES